MRDTNEVGDRVWVDERLLGTITAVEGGMVTSVRCESCPDLVLSGSFLPPAFDEAVEISLDDLGRIRQETIMAALKQHHMEAHAWPDNLFTHGVHRVVAKGGELVRIAVYQNLDTIILDASLSVQINCPHCLASHRHTMRATQDTNPAGAVVRESGRPVIAGREIVGCPKCGKEVFLDLRAALLPLSVHLCSAVDTHRGHTATAGGGH